MRNDEMKLYRYNNVGYNLILLFIALNTIYSITILNSINPDFKLGLFIMVTIVIFLLGFLAAIKVQRYSRNWSIFAVLLGIYQLTRLTYYGNELTKVDSRIISLLIIVSAVACIAGGVISYINTARRLEFIKNSTES